MSGCCWYAMLRWEIDCPTMFRVIDVQYTLRDTDVRVLKGRQNEKLNHHSSAKKWNANIFVRIGRCTALPCSVDQKNPSSIL